MKSIFESKVFWVAVIQAVGGVVVVALTEVDAIGYIAIVKSVVDILLRLVTTKTIS